MKKSILLFALLCLFAVGCSSNGSYKEIFKEKISYNSKEFAVGKDLLNTAVLKTIYSKNFVVEKEDLVNGLISAKHLSEKGKATIVLMLTAKMIVDSPEKTTLYLNAVETTERVYVLDRTRFFLFLIPLPGGGGLEAKKVIEEEKQIKDKNFYQQFISEVERQLKGLMQQV